MFNRWRKFPENKPKEKGWYMCTIEVPGMQRYTMMLFWYPDKERFINNTRQDVFDIFDVYGDKKVRMLTDRLCDRTDEVVAWKKCPKTYMKGFIEEKPYFLY